ncbi:hypothetical protein [Thermophilibacter provencensis]|uniref:hypothetical protein n=1 Tax=Thermophilibacter provencensis TaxID=1852386 RepID=UPI0023564509|nr:hypothetical protein [Thermophilibacter provencensis]
MGFAFEDYDEPRAVPLYITTPTQSIFNQNELYTTRYDAVGFSLEDLPKGTLIDGEFAVETSTPFKECEWVFELKRIGNANV